MKRLLFGAITLGLFFLAGCQTRNLSEAQRFEASVRKELPFRVDSLRWIDGVGSETYQLFNHYYIPTLPDAEIGMDGNLSAYNFEKPTLQDENKVWRNIVISPKKKRVICIDRYMKKGVTHGYVYVLQSETKKYPTLGKYHWDVSDLHNVEMLGNALEHLRGLTLKRIKSGGSLYVAPSSQDHYWTLMFHADSLFADGLYAEAKQIYDLAFSDDRYILPSQLSTVAKKMMAIRNDETAQAYFNHRVQSECRPSK